MHVFQKSGLPQPIIDKIWTICDLDHDASLTVTEFCIAMHLLYAYLNRQIHEIPDRLPDHLLPTGGSLATNRTTNVAASGFKTPVSATVSPVTPHSAKPILFPSAKAEIAQSERKQDLIRFFKTLQSHQVDVDALSSAIDTKMKEKDAALRHLDEAIGIEKRRSALLADIRRELDIK